MATKVRTKGKSSSTTVKQEEVLTKYIDLMTDFGFKRIFGEDANKDLLIDFLNAALNIDGGIKKLEYGNPEKQGRIKTDRKVIFDLYCITKKGERIIVEMQKLPQTYYKERTLYYASFLIHEQGEKRKRWNYNLCPVYVVNVLNFKFKEEDSTNRKSKKSEEGLVQKYVSRIKLMDEDTKKVFYKKLIFVYIELPNFTKTIDELENNFERWMYVLQHIHKMDEIPATLLQNKIFKKIFELAKVANMTRAEINAYNRSLKNKRSMNMVKMEMRERDRALAIANRALATANKTLAQHVNAIAQKDNAIAQQGNTISAMEKEIAEYRRLLGLKQQ